jgi:hypothetical protein
VLPNFRLDDWLAGIVRPTPQKDPRAPWRLLLAGAVVLVGAVLAQRLLVG